MQHCKTVILQFKKNLEKEMYFSYCAEICLLVSNPPLHLQCTHILALVLSIEATRDKPAPGSPGFIQSNPVPLHLGFLNYRINMYRSAFFPPARSFLDLPSPDHFLGR